MLSKYTSSSCRYSNADMSSSFKRRSESSARGYRDVAVPGGHAAAKEMDVHKRPRRDEEHLSSRWDTHGKQPNIRSRGEAYDNGYYGLGVAPTASLSASTSLNSRSDSGTRCDWQCFECKMWNLPDDSRCERCGITAVFSDRYDCYQKHKHYHRGTNGSFFDSGAEVSSDEIDEFGRIKQKRSKPAPSRDWPPRFEDSGLNYAFDSRSGMFYEAISDFFYDPNSKLYFGNKTSTYYKFNHTVDPPFEQVQKVESSGIDLMNQDSINNKGSKQKTAAISIKLKTTSLETKKVEKDQANSTKASTAATVKELSTVTLPSRLLKQHTDDIKKWSERQQEIREEVLADKVETIKSPPDTEDKLSNLSQKKEQILTKTVKGEPICTLCRRKFPSVEKLRYHEQASQLHKDNLAKQSIKDKQNASESSEKLNENNLTSEINYVDRAKQRRDMYGPEPVGPSLLPVTTCASVQHSDTFDINSSTLPVPAKCQDPFDESNVGRRMLEKLGWKNGSTTDVDEPLATNLQHELLAKDWDRMERIAAESQLPRRPYGPGAKQVGGLSLR